MRVRGLKRLLTWSLRRWLYVAPHAGAWIETFMPGKLLTWRGSHPMRVRGLKHWLLDPNGMPVLVAPHAGAWIETLSTA